jgi:Helix-turn-helix domain of resolvase
MAAKIFTPCQDACMYAKGDDCECYCNGENHKVGTNGLIPAEFNEVTRTTAGRLINPVFPDADQAANAEWMLAMHDDGMTRREIAKLAGVAPATVRRYITRLLLAEELAAEATEAA